jgi:hypothetical protein
MISQVLPQYLQAVCQSATLDEMKLLSKKNFDRIADILFPGQKVVLKEDLEPQSELEESKENNDFAAAVLKECKNFEDALANYEIVQVKDISDLTKANKNHQKFIEEFGKFQGEFNHGF